VNSEIMDCKGTKIQGGNPWNLTEVLSLVCSAPGGYPTVCQPAMLSVATLMSVRQPAMLPVATLVSVSLTQLWYPGGLPFRGQYNGAPCPGDVKILKSLFCCLDEKKN